MSRPEGLSEWEAELSTHLSGMNRSLVWGLALWSYGMIVARSCGITSVVAVLVVLVGRKPDAVRQQLREWYYDAEDKRGRNRSEVVVSESFGDLLRWILAWGAPDEKRLALALDATTLRQRFTVLAISVVYRGCAIPVAWAIVPACKPEAWRPPLGTLAAPAGAGRPGGLDGDCDGGSGLVWTLALPGHSNARLAPLLAHQSSGHYAPTGEGFRPLATAVPQVGTRWAGRVTCFSTRAASLDCTRLACWEAQHQDPWLILTDLPPEIAQVAWYAMRFWIERLFKATKRGGWH